MNKSILFWEKEATLANSRLTQEERKYKKWVVVNNNGNYYLALQYKDIYVSANQSKKKSFLFIIIIITLTNVL